MQSFDVSSVVVDITFHGIMTFRTVTTLISMKDRPIEIFHF